jgi:hypothetical protein
MTTLREQIATNVLTVTKFRELLREMRENRPNDDLELFRKAYEFSQRYHSGQQRADALAQARASSHRVREDRVDAGLRFRGRTPKAGSAG